MTNKKRRRPSRQQASKKRRSVGIFRGAMWLVRLIYLLLEVWDLLKMTSGPFSKPATLQVGETARHDFRSWRCFGEFSPRA